MNPTGRFAAAGMLTAICGFAGGCATGPDGRTMDAYPVVSVAWSPDGRTIAAGANTQGVVYLLDARDQQIRAVLRGEVVDFQSPTKGPALAFSLDGRRLATAGLQDGITARIWDVDSGKEVGRFPGSRRIRSLMFSPDGRRIAAAGPGEMITVWDGTTGAVLKQWKAHTDAVISIAFTRDGSAIASGGEDRVLKIWNAGTFEQVGVMEGFSGDVTGIGFSPDGRRMATAAAGRDVRVHEYAAAAQYGSVTQGRALIESRAAGAADSGLVQLLLLISAARTVQITRAPTYIPSVGAAPAGAPQPRTHCDPNVTFSPDGKWVAAVVDQLPPDARNIDRLQYGLQIHIVDLAGGTEVVTDRVIGCSIAFSPDGKTLASGGHAASVRIYNSATGMQLNTPPR